MIHTAKCVICDFPLYDFIIKKEYKFIRNIYNSDVWNKSNDIRKLHNFYEQILCKSCIHSLWFLWWRNQCWTYKSWIEEFLNNYHPDADLLPEVLEEIHDININNLGRKMNKKLRQIIIAIVYIRLMQFPNKQFFIPTIVTKNFF